MAASLSSNVRHALERQEFQSQREFREAALFARKRLLRLIERLDERLDLSGASSPTLHGLPFLAKIGVDVAIDSAAAVAVPQILALPAVGAESIVSGGMALGAQLIMHTLEKTWRAVSDYREIRKPLLPTVGEDPVLQILSLLQSMVQQGRSIAAQHFPDQLAMSAVHTALDRYTSMMRKTLLDLPGHLNSWTVAEKMLTHVRFEPPYADADFDAKQLSRALDEVWEERSGGAHGRSL
ncbi:hypothetical protein ASE68_00940 [Agromyces sp. Leaf222]|nr:hypothetical protein ASE68_00940 [Agromyces sp. Leaf222]